MSRRLEWDRDGRDWPNRDASRFVSAGGVRWHVQQAGTGPSLLLVHGTGASTHSWRGLFPLLTQHFAVLAPDLPGHAFTGPLPGGHMSLEGMANAMDALLREVGFTPALAVGHSAGAAIVAQLALERAIAPKALVSLNGAILHLSSMPRFLYSPLAKLLAATPLIPRIFAQRASDPRAVERLIASTGSTLDATGVDLYARLVRDPGHVGNVLDMMAHWDLRRIERELPRLDLPVFLVVGERDTTVPPSEAERVRALLPNAQIVMQPGLGHLAHEEAPAETERLLLRIAGEAGLRSARSQSVEGRPALPPDVARPGC
jgi:magnesium chelatase accessory protein